MRLRRITCLLMMCSVVACGRGRADRVENEIADLLSRSVPGTGRLLERSGPSARDGGIDACWEIELSGWTWDRYRDWLTERLSEYRALENGSKLVLHRSFEGDAYALSVAPQEIGPPGRFRLEFRADAF